jgi:large subunit ribosomal protein L9
VAQAILLKDVESLGSAGDAVDVSPGYLRNYLQPRKLAQPATQASLDEAQRRREAAERAAKDAEERAGETAALLSKTVLTIQHRAGEDGKLFGSVTNAEIAEALAQARGLKVDRKKIRLDDPIREVGTYMVEVEISGGVTAKVKTIVAEQKKLAPPPPLPPEHAAELPSLSEITGCATGAAVVCSVAVASGGDFRRRRPSN